jgi:hypothetical protein
MKTFKRIVRLLLQAEGSHIGSERLPVLNLEQFTQD